MAADPGREMAERETDQGPLLDERVGVLAAQIHALSAQLVDTLAELDSVGGWAGPGFRSFGHWLSVRAGFVPREADRLIRLAQRVDRVPTLMSHARAGEISVGMCEVAARVATPSNEAAVAEVVRLGTPSQAARVLRQYRRLAPPTDSKNHATDGTATDPAHQLPAPDPPIPLTEDREWWSAFFDDDGMYRGSFCLGPVRGEMLRQAVEGARRAGERDRDHDAADDRSPRDRSPIPIAEAIERMATTTLDLVNGTGITAPGGERFCVQVAVDVEVLARILGVTLDPMTPTKIRLGDRCHIVGGPTISDAELARIVCDFSFQVLVHDDGIPLWMGNEQRTANRHQRRALQFRDGGCHFPGCRQTRFVDAHHVRFHGHGGATSLDNLVLLCGFHHRQLHRGDFSIVALGRQRFRFLNRWGHVIGRPPHEDNDDAPPLPLRLVPDAPPDVGPDTPRPIGRGEQLTAYGLDVLLGNLLKAA